jgi:hypothetical protein
VKRARFVGFCAVALMAGGCTRVLNAVSAPDAGMACTPQSADSDCTPTPWPTGDHTANSDPWLVTHNQVITSMSPKVLVLNFDNGQSNSQTMAYAQEVTAALSAGSIYHGYSDTTAPAFLNYTIKKVVDLTDSGTVSANIPLTATGDFDPNALFTNAQFAHFYDYPSTSATGGYLSLCQLFEQGIINEVWIQDGGGTQLPDGTLSPRAPLYAERKQIYGDDGVAIAGDFDQCIGGGGSGTQTCLNVPCGVTVRLAHLDPSPAGGPGCDVQVRGWGIEGMWTALPSSLAVDANAFLNQDFRTRFGVSFDGWSEICTASPCVSYPNPMRAKSTSGDATTFDIDPFLQGCGSSLYPPNATAPDDFENSNPVNSRCAGFGLGGGSGGGDVYAPYYADSVIAGYDQMYTGNSACKAGWEIYWRQSMPGYQNKATASDKTPMKNWWPVLFY